ncbi:class I SAM-dependent methyltransferase [Hoyosella rhizosphaerae]|uniref:Methyltransferase n=1 Tax=Hoyosella rhizosphaerae TaxID=1755582 RepID=A0A916U121_9ACTN|nr:class I SAM-dependent methyltransferase [Hoyosella rhizosphaerae]GGC53876.1 methyltransferase [Hoyosella rhizosphaerae]
MTADNDRARWNARYTSKRPTFEPQPILSDVLTAGISDGPVLELACGASGNAVTLASLGRHVTAVDISDVGLGQLRCEADNRGLTSHLDIVEADLSDYQPREHHYALVIATFFWDGSVFDAACNAVMPGGVIAWQALSTPTMTSRPFRIHHGALSARLPDGFTVIREHQGGVESHAWTCLYARR